jgi:hypothetical protein
MLSSVTFRCGHLQSSPLPSFCNTSSVSATERNTAATDIFESRIGQVAVVPEFQKRSENYSLRRLMFGFWIITVKPGFVSYYDPQEEVLVIFVLIQKLLADKHMPLLLLIGKQPRHKLHRDPLHVQVLY